MSTPEPSDLDDRSENFPRNVADPNPADRGAEGRDMSGQFGDGEERYRRLFETAQEGIVLTSPAGEILDCNPALCRLTGYEREELIGMQASRLYDREAREQLVRALQKNGQVEGLKMRLRCRNGNELLCLISAILWTDNEGRPKAIQSFVRDVTGEARAREALAESEEKFRTLAENAPVGIGLLQEGSGQKWAVTYANPAFARIFGYAPNEIVGRSPKELSDPQDWPSVREWIQNRLDGTGEARLKARGRTKSGETRHVELFGGRTSYQGKPAIIGGLVDITKHRQLQREILKVQEKERRRLGQDLHDGVASHLIGIRMKLGALANRTEKSREEVSRESIANSIREMENMVGKCAEDVRQLSRGLCPTAFSDEGLLEALERLAENTDGCFLDVDEEIEAAGGPSGLSAEERTQLYWIAQEAVANARRHAEASEILIRLTKDEDGSLTFAVEDDGEGFNVSEVDQKGLGLRSIQHRAELMEADLSVDSELGEGTRVRCRLPR